MKKFGFLVDSDIKIWRQNSLKKVFKFKKKKAKTVLIDLVFQYVDRFSATLVCKSSDAKISLRKSIVDLKKVPYFSSWLYKGLILQSRH